MQKDCTCKKKMGIGMCSEGEVFVKRKGHFYLFDTISFIHASLFFVLKGPLLKTLFIYKGN